MTEEEAFAAAVAKGAFAGMSDPPYRRKEVLAEGVILYLGDCREIWPTLGPVDVVATDPPFGMEFQSNHRSEQHERIDGDDDLALLQWACALPAKHAKYVFCRWDNLADVPKPKSLVTWVKNNWSMGDLAHEHGRQTEVALFYPGPAHFFPNGRPADVIEAPRTGNDNHPTEKPVMLMRSILGWTAGNVCDPFMGAGATGIAAARLGRSFVGIELKPKYFDIACRRISEALKQPDLFIDPPKPSSQLTLEVL